MTDLIGGVPDELLGGPTPCVETSLGDLLDHVSGLTLAFIAAATKATGETGSQAPSAETWRDPAAWSGMTEAGGRELPGEVAGLVALDELVIHGWDLARASGQPYDCDQETLEAVHGFVVQFSEPRWRRSAKGSSDPWSRCRRTRRSSIE